MTETDPKTLPQDVRAKILAAKEAIVRGDSAGAYHSLYAIADPTFTKNDAWAELMGDLYLADGDAGPVIMAVDHCELCGCSYAKGTVHPCMQAESPSEGDAHAGA